MNDNLNNNSDDFPYLGNYIKSFKFAAHNFKDIRKAAHRIILYSLLFYFFYLVAIFILFLADALWTNNLSISIFYHSLPIYTDKTLELKDYYINNLSIIKILHYFFFNILVFPVVFGLYKFILDRLDNHNTPVSALVTSCALMPLTRRIKIALTLFVISAFIYLLINIPLLFEGRLLAVGFIISMCFTVISMGMFLLSLYYLLENKGHEFRALGHMLNFSTHNISKILLLAINAFFYSFICMLGLILALSLLILPIYLLDFFLYPLLADMPGYIHKLYLFVCVIIYIIPAIWMSAYFYTSYMTYIALFYKEQCRY